MSREGEEPRFFKIAMILSEVKEFIESSEKRKCKRVLEDIKHLAQEAMEASDIQLTKSYIKAILKEIERYG